MTPVKILEFGDELSFLTTSVNSGNLSKSLISMTFFWNKGGGVLGDREDNGGVENRER